jgi:hypothetical protein
LKSHLRVTIATLLERGASQHEIARRTGVDRKTIRRYAERSNSPMATGSEPEAGQIPPPWPPARPPKEVRSACESHRAWIEQQVALGRNAVAIYQDLVERHDFAHRYNSVTRFVRALKRRDPERFDVLESAPGEEAQVDFGLGALTLANSQNQLTERWRLACVFRKLRLANEPWGSCTRGQGALRHWLAERRGQVAGPWTEQRRGLEPMCANRVCRLLSWHASCTPDSVSNGTE